MDRYKPQDIEKRWQAKWEADGLYKTPTEHSGKKYYNLVMFPYSSGDLHIGHWYNFAPADIHARFKRMQGYEVLNPFGYDSFGLPAENAAIKNNVPPEKWTEENIARMTTQLKTTGNSYDWDKAIFTHRPDYYKWTQWMFLLMYKEGLAYRVKQVANWCPSCQTVLANEQVESGVCWRCGTEVEQKMIDQWMFAITKYADRLLEDLKKLDWPQQTLTMQANWIGRSEGAEIDFGVDGSTESVRVFTTRADTIFGATFLVIAPEHPLIGKITRADCVVEVDKYVKEAKKKLELERISEGKSREGVFSGAYAINPISKSKVPIYVADYVLMGYGTGAIMGVPAHDKRDHDFAKKYELEIRKVIIPTSRPELDSGSISKEIPDQVRNDTEELFTGYGTLVDSGEYTGNTSEEAIQKIKKHIKDNHLGGVKVNYHLRDWVVSRQRYWGAPIPIIHCEKCGIVPVPESDLPIMLPNDVDYTPKGTSPLGTSRAFVNTKCPKCEGSAKRETDTMDTFVDSSWYFLRFPNPNIDTSAFDKNEIDYWLPVDMYIGGAEHTVLHLLYSRFFTKVLFDKKLIKFDEPFTSLRHQGMVLGPDGEKMSKSKGNVINPDTLVNTYGADTVRLYLSFMAPYELGGAWNHRGIEGCYRFLNRVWNLAENYAQVPNPDLNKDSLRVMHKTIKKVSEDIELLHFNTAIASLMEWLNYLHSKKTVSKIEVSTYLFLLAPFAPHMTEEVWSSMGNTTSIHKESWPELDPEYLVSDTVTLVVQVDGKVRERLTIKSGATQEEVEKQARDAANVKKYLDASEAKQVIFVADKLINFVTI